MRPLIWVDVRTRNSVCTDMAYTPGSCRFGQVWHLNGKWVLYLADAMYGKTRTECPDRDAAIETGNQIWEKYNQHEDHHHLPDVPS